MQHKYDASAVLQREKWYQSRIKQRSTGARDVFKNVLLKVKPYKVVKLKVLKLN